uniref:Uncharacterized protein n=1 Tax=Oryza punctata TaxID=4537 RepID=A0A0E0JI61_ORYPU
MRHPHENGARQLVAVAGSLHSAAWKNLLEKQSARKGTVPDISVMAAMTSMAIGMVGPCSWLFRSTFLSAMARSTGHTMITTASAKERERFIRASWDRKNLVD